MKIKELWRSDVAATTELVPSDNEFFLVKFIVMENYEFAKFGGPWMISNQYLTIRPWHPNFDPTQDTSEDFWSGFGSHAFLLNIAIKNS